MVDGIDAGKGANAADDPSEDTEDHRQTPPAQNGHMQAHERPAGKQEQARTHDNDGNRRNGLNGSEPRDDIGPGKKVIKPSGRAQSLVVQCAITARGDDEKITTSSVSLAGRRLLIDSYRFLAPTGRLS